MSDKTTAKAWSEAIAALVVDALRYAKIVQKDDNDRAIEIAADEIYARLCVRDYPPHMDGDPSANDT
jgi:hypothetical protein